MRSQAAMTGARPARASASPHLLSGLGLLPFLSLIVNLFPLLRG